MSEVRLELENVSCPDWWVKGRKVGKHSRKLNGETFVAPRIILPPDYNDLIGQMFFLFDAEAKLEFDNFWKRRKVEGRAIILVVPEKIEEEPVEIEWGDEGDEGTWVQGCDHMDPVVTTRGAPKDCDHSEFLEGVTTYRQGGD